MPIKNLDDELFKDNEAPKKIPRRQTPPPHINTSDELFDEIGKLMQDIPEDVMDKIKDFSANLEDKFNIEEIFNVEVKNIKLNNPIVKRLIDTLAKLEYSEIDKASDKIEELITYLENIKNVQEEKKDTTNVEKTQKIIDQISSFKDNILSVEVEEFIADEFIKTFNLTDNRINLTLTDFTDITFTNPINNELIDLTSARLVYGEESNRTHSPLGDRVLLYLRNDTYLILYAYKKDGKYHLYLPQKNNFGLVDCGDKISTRKIKEKFFKCKNISNVLKQINQVFVLKKDTYFPLLELGNIVKEDVFYSGNAFIKIGSYIFSEDKKVGDFKQKFDVSDSKLDFYIKINSNLASEVDSFIEELKNYDFTQKILNNFELKYNHQNNYLYFEI